MDILEATLDSSGLSHPPKNISGLSGRRAGQVESLQERETPTKGGGSWWQTLSVPPLGVPHSGPHQRVLGGHFSPAPPLCLSSPPGLSSQLLTAFAGIISIQIMCPKPLSRACVRDPDEDTSAPHLWQPWGMCHTKFFLTEGPHVRPPPSTVPAGAQPHGPGVKSAGSSSSHSGYPGPLVPWPLHEPQHTASQRWPAGQQEGLCDLGTRCSPNELVQETLLSADGCQPVSQNPCVLVARSSWRD